MNFCVTILILKMAENRQHFGILCFTISRKVKMQMKCKKEKLCTVCGEGAVTDWTYQKWFAKFRAGDFLLDEAPQWVRPAKVNSYQIETLIKNNQRSTTWEIANILKISKLIKLLVKMKKLSFIFRKKLNGHFVLPNTWLSVFTHKFFAKTLSISL